MRAGRMQAALPRRKKASVFSMLSDFPLTLLRPERRCRRYAFQRLSVSFKASTKRQVHRILCGAGLKNGDLPGKDSENDLLDLAINRAPARKTGDPLSLSETGCEICSFLPSGLYALKILSLRQS